MTGRREVVVIGGGQAGLAIGWFLARQGRSFTVLDAAAEPAAAWRGRWDSLRLFTPVRYDSLPGRAFPGDPDGYPGRDDVVDYLTDYARRFELPVELNSRVRSVRQGDAGYVVEIDDDRVYEADQVVIATGAWQIPWVPPLAQRLDRAVVQYHSTNYRSPEDVPAGTVLVVGGGNTGFQIAKELTVSHDVHLSIGSKQPAFPQRIFGRDLFRYLVALGLMEKSIETRIGRRGRKNDSTLIGSSPRALRRHGATVRTRAIDGKASGVVFDDGTALTVDSVIWATGFRPDHSWVELPVFDAGGRVAHQRGVTASPGLYFLGLPWMYTQGSALLGWVKNDAEFIAQRIEAGRSASPAPPVPAKTAQ